jgi:hypothetical protein
MVALVEELVEGSGVVGVERMSWLVLIVLGIDGLSMRLSSSLCIHLNHSSDQSGIPSTSHPAQHRIFGHLDPNGSQAGQAVNTLACDRRDRFRVNIVSSFRVASEDVVTLETAVIATAHEAARYHVPWYTDARPHRHNEFKFSLQLVVHAGSSE